MPSLRFVVLHRQSSDFSAGTKTCVTQFAPLPEGRSEHRPLHPRREDVGRVHAHLRRQWAWGAHYHEHGWESRGGVVRLLLSAPSLGLGSSRQRGLIYRGI